VRGNCRGLHSPRKDVYVGRPQQAGFCGVDAPGYPEYKKPETKTIKVISVPDRSYYKTPNGCYYHLIYFEIIIVNVKTGKTFVREIPELSAGLFIRHLDMEHRKDILLEVAGNGLCCLHKTHKPNSGRLNPGRK